MLASRKKERNIARILLTSESVSMNRSQRRDVLRVQGASVN
jgi:hypothetical protein